MVQPTSAIPDFYYFWFAAYEPFLTIAGFIGAWFDPLAAHNAQAPWSDYDPPPDSLSMATLVTLIQLGHVCALLGVINIFVLSSARWYLHDQPAIQERIVFSLMTPLLVGDVLHLYVTFWAYGDQKWSASNWSPMMWANVVIGTSILLPRIAWHLGIRRYVDIRDGNFSKIHDIPRCKNTDTIEKRTFISQDT